MSRFHYMSDLHIEFAMPKAMLFTGENLILAGDITCLRCLNPVMNDAGNRKMRDRTLKFFEIAQENFKRVFYLTGNHESYNFNIGLEDTYIKKYLPGVIHLKNTTYELDDKTVIFGGTLWTDMDKRNPITMGAIMRGMNDFRLIYTGVGDDHTPKIFRPEDAADRFDVTMAALKEALEKHKDKNVIVATHHAPIRKGINSNHVSDTMMNHGYHTDLEQFIMDHPQIKYWVFGHTHIQDKFTIGETQVVSNARGYEGYESCADQFVANTYFDL